jgi:hypothetical protein
VSKITAIIALRCISFLRDRFAAWAMFKIQVSWLFALLPRGKAFGTAHIMYAARQYIFYEIICMTSSTYFIRDYS